MNVIDAADLSQEIRDMVDVPLTDDQVQTIAQRAFRYNGEGFVQTISAEEFWALVEGLATAPQMTPAEFRGIREQLGLGEEDLARLLGNSRSAIQKRERGSLTIPAVVAAKLEELQDEYHDTIDDLVNEATSVLRVPGPGADEWSWDTTGRPPRWHRQIAAVVRMQTGCRIEWASQT